MLFRSQLDAQGRAHARHRLVEQQNSRLRNQRAHEIEELALAARERSGQRKLLDLVRALMAQPRILLLDEPMAGVSPTLRVELLEHILALRERDGITLLIVEHDLDFVMRASDRVIVMNDGRVIMHGTPNDVRADQRVIDAYLGAHVEGT